MMKYIAFLFFVCNTYPTWSQSFNADTLKVQLIKDWKRAKEYTREFLQTMPADKYDWQPEQNTRSFARQMLHTTYLNIGYVSNGTGQVRNFLGVDLSIPIEETRSSKKDSVIYYTMAGYDFVITGITSMKSTDLLEKGKFGILKLAWINKAFEHLTHHRGQCVIYFRLLGIEPPHEKLFEG